LEPEKAMEPQCPTANHATTNGSFACPYGEGHAAIVMTWLSLYFEGIICFSASVYIPVYKMSHRQPSGILHLAYKKVYRFLSQEGLQEQEDVSSMIIML
jgi:hypothetical protein